MAPFRLHRPLSAARTFGSLAAGFVVIFAALALWLGISQQEIIDTTRQLKTATVPEISRYQRLSRNLEQLRQEGERIFAADSTPTRLQAMYVVTLVASHPSVLDYPEAAELARRTERFLVDSVRQAADGGNIPAGRYDEWQVLAARLSLLSEDIAQIGINHADRDLDRVDEAMQRSRYKLFAALGLVAFFSLVFQWLLLRHLLRPLHAIDHALATLQADAPVPTFSAGGMAEIATIERAIGDLHGLLQEDASRRQQLEQLANVDDLTGLTNRRHFMLEADNELQRADRYGRPITVAMADLDHFKGLNDTYGHAAGDAVLRAFAILAQETVRQSDLVCRYGGEEFAFVFPEITLAEAHKLGERLRSRFEQLDVRTPDGRLVRATLSMGLAPASKSTIESALRRADDALYVAKNSGRNRVEIASPD